MLFIQRCNEILGKAELGEGTVHLTADEILELVHKDNADVSFVVLLSDPDDFELVGGGKAATQFEAFGPVALQQAEAIVMNGQLVHESVPLLKGRRYVLSGFTYMDAKYLDMKRRDTLVTMAYSH